MSQNSFLSIVRTHDADHDLLEYIKGFVYDKGGRCLKSEIIQAIMLNLIGIGINVQDGLKRADSCKENTFGGKWSPFIFRHRSSTNHKSVIIERVNNLHQKLEEFESGSVYKGTGLSIETSKMTGRIIYKYVEPVESNDESLIDLSSKFEIGVKVSESSKRKKLFFADTSKPFVFGNPYVKR